MIRWTSSQNSRMREKRQYHNTGTTAAVRQPHEGIQRQFVALKSPASLAICDQQEERREETQGESLISQSGLTE